MAFAGYVPYNSVIANTNSGANSIGLTKLGTGTLTLTGANTYTGATTVNGGTLLIDGNNSVASGAVTVNSGGTLGGKGAIGGAVTVNLGGTITAGPTITSPELNINSNLTLNSNATYQVKLFGTGAADISLLTVNSANVSIDSGALIKLDLSALNAGQVSTRRNAGPVTYNVIQVFGVGSSNNFDPNNFSISNLGNFDASEWSLVSTPVGGLVQLQFTPVPEPAAVLGIAVAALGVGGFVRRRLRKPTEATTAA